MILEIPLFFNHSAIMALFFLIFKIISMLNISISTDSMKILSSAFDQELANEGIEVKKYLFTIYIQFHNIF